MAPGISGMVDGNVSRYHTAQLRRTLLNCLAGAVIPPLRPPDGLLGPTFWEAHYRDLVLGVLALIAVGALLVCRRRRSTAVVEILPGDLARQELSARQGKPEDDLLVGEVSGIVKRYVTAAFALPREQLTTEEFLGAVRQCPVIDHESWTTLEGLLRDCDQKKFAPARGALPADFVARGLELVDRLEARRSPPASTGQPENAGTPAASIG